MQVCRGAGARRHQVFRALWGRAALLVSWKVLLNTTLLPPVAYCPVSLPWGAGGGGRAVCGVGCCVTPLLQLLLGGAGSLRVLAGEVLGW